MSNQSAIEWTEATWNPVRGCTKVSPGCAHCYAETFAERFRGVKGHPYEQGFDLRLVPEKLDEPLRRKKPTTYFVNSMSDLFQDGVPDDYIDRVFAVMAWATWHTFQILTKRAERMRAYFSQPWHQRVARVYREMREATPRRELIAVPDHLQRQQGWAFGSLTCGEHARRFLPNVWLGVSVENQHFAAERIPLLLQTPAAVRFISAEPLLEGIDIRRWLMAARCISTGIPMRRVPEKDLPGLDWVIVGGESGHGARPFEVAWARSIVAQCQANGVPVFVKQLGADPRDAAAQRDDMGARDVWPASWMPTIDGRRVWRPDLTNGKGGDPTEWPADLRVREMPGARG